jgi:hypothetical protein
MTARRAHRQFFRSIPLAFALGLALLPGVALAQSVVELSGTVSASSLTSMINAKPAGPVTVRPAAGQTTATVTGVFAVPRPAVTLSKLTFVETVSFGNGAGGSQMLNCKAKGFDIFGADDIVVRGSSFDGQGIDNQNIIWDSPAGTIPERFTIENNSFTRFYASGQHSEALYVGYSADGLVQGNVFEDNGNTAHIFFTYWGSTANPSVSYPRRICVRNNVFGATHGAYFDINFRDEIPLSSGIAIDPAQGASSTHGAFTRACPNQPGPPAPPVLLAP